MANCAYSKEHKSLQERTKEAPMQTTRMQYDKIRGERPLVQERVVNERNDKSKLLNDSLYARIPTKTSKRRYLSVPLAWFPDDRAGHIVCLLLHEHLAFHVTDPPLLPPTS